MNGRRAFAPYPDLLFGAKDLFTAATVSIFPAGGTSFRSAIRTAPLFWAATGLGQLTFLIARSLFGRWPTDGDSRQGPREAEGAWHMARTPGCGPGSALLAPFLVAINIERRRNSDFVIYC
jgi:hypothetical protein